MPAFIETQHPTARLYFVTEDQDLARKITAAHQPAIAIPSKDLIRTLNP